ncbi:MULTISPECIES: OsmC family protein [unclassified Cryobacterium]|uniref:OsmC family protein n=1 Tax=unclassified Cryobacterium TaxID=2649013 RepID=UPI002AB531B0|nr:MULTISPECIES: OsmC family protein [unclassified Cryobacterium]MDY7544480.1 OsmC family protein [Cryobacterium sp. 5B3]MEB0001088.1 OsmC family protein [Cryobacterium sp. RTS3]MEB0267594.1 OsmC family protein [Cryobacterium sp. 10I5]MEB0276745.1 OsmC family protein [Cryobacterium sp. 5B3]
MTDHTYAIELAWTGNTGQGTKNIRSYSRDHDIAGDGLPSIAASSDPAFRGDPSRWNPEQLYVASIAQCHMLWYLGLAAKSGVTVVGYEDRPTGLMIEEANGAGQFDNVTLHPIVTITADSDADVAEELHHRVADYCFIARSVQTPIRYAVTISKSDS